MILLVWSFLFLFLKCLAFFQLCFPPLPISLHYPALGKGLEGDLWMFAFLCKEVWWFLSNVYAIYLICWFMVGKRRIQLDTISGNNSFLSLLEYKCCYSCVISTEENHSFLFSFIAIYLFGLPILLSLCFTQVLLIWLWIGNSWPGSSANQHKLKLENIHIMIRVSLSK